MAKILIAEDHPSISFPLAAILEDAGHDVVLSADGECALKTLKEEEGFDLLITDMQMPKMGGRQLVEKVLQQERFSGLPIIIMSANHITAEIDNLLKAGASAFLKKPMDLDRFVDCVDSLIHSESQTQDRVASSR